MRPTGPAFGNMTTEIVARMLAHMTLSKILFRCGSVYLMALLIATGIAHAHHAPALYDNDRLMKIDGHVVALNYRYPHSELLLITDADQTWTVSLAPPDVSERQGKKQALLAIEPGEPITVYGWPHRIKEMEIRSHKMLLSDDRIITGAVNSLYEPKVQTDLRQLLADPQHLQTLEESDRVLHRLALDIHADRATFIGFEDEDSISYPGIKEHLVCLAELFGHRLHSGDADATTLDDATKYNEWYARYLEGRLNICD